MWNVRTVLRNLTVRLKSSAHAAQSTKEGRSEFEEEYRQFWCNSIRHEEGWKSVIPKPYPNGPRNAYFLYNTPKHSANSGDGNSRSDSEKESSNWDASRFCTNRSWVEALGWGAALGLGLNVLHPVQEEILRKRCPLEQFSAYGFVPKWISSFYALSMPVSSHQNPLIKSVVPAELTFESQTAPSVEEDGKKTISSSQYSDCSSSNVSDHERPAYSSESSALMSIMRDHLTSIARDYITELQNLLGQTRDSQHAVDSATATAQEEYNLGLFHELGIGVRRNQDAALDHYVAAALLEHPIAIANLRALHRYTDVSPQTCPIRRSSSSPTLSITSSGKFSTELPELVVEVHEKIPQGKFWSDHDACDSSSSDSGASFSRSASYPDLPHLISCK